MVAISTDIPHWSHHRPTERYADVQPLAPAGPARPITPLARVLLAVAAVVVVVAVAVGTAAFGRMLDSQRGIPASGAAPASAPVNAP